MDIKIIRRFIVFPVFFISAYNSYAITHETIRSRTLSLDLPANIGTSIRETECSMSRTAFAAAAALNYLRYNRSLKDGDLRPLQFWTNRPWPNVPSMDYEINGVNINDMKVQSFHFSVKAPSVDVELSIFLLAFFSHGNFKFALYFNENIGAVGFSFQEVVGCNLLLRRIPEWPYLNEQEVSIQQTFLGHLRQGVDTCPSRKPRQSQSNRTIQTNDVEVVVDGL